MKYLCIRPNGKECYVNTELEYHPGDVIEVIFPAVLESKEAVDVIQIMETE